MNTNITCGIYRLLWLQLILFLIFFGRIYAQQPSNCPNSDFEYGGFSNWSGDIGSNSGPPTGVYMNSAGFINGRHTIMSGQGLDINSCNQIAEVYPGGGMYTARIGNSNSGAEAEDLTYTFWVDSTNNLLIYHYAVLLQLGYHTTDEESFFEIKIQDAAGNITDAPCSYLMYNASNTNGPDWYTCNGDIKYRKWETLGVDLTPYIGQSITVVITSADCALGGHFGYGYIDMYNAPLKIETQYCGSGGAATLTAPSGFSYLWSPGNLTTQSIHIPQAQNGSIYQCVLSSLHNAACKTTLTAVLQASVIPANFQSSQACAGDVQFNDISYPITSGNSWQWNFGDPGSGAQNLSVLQNPNHHFNNPGTYSVTFLLSNVNGCKDSVVKNIIVPQRVQTQVSSSCLGNSNTFAASMAQGKTWQWYFGDGSSSGAQNAVHTYSSCGSFQVKLVAVDSSNCRDSSLSHAQVNCLPVADFSFSNPQCPNDSAHFMDHSSILNGQINQTTWNWGDGSGLSNFSAGIHTSHYYLQGGSYLVSMTAVSNSGCIDSVKKTLIIPFSSVSLGVFQAVCSSDAPFLLNGGQPQGGVYEVDGTPSSLFNPALAGIGTHTIIYSYIDTSGCQSSAYQSIQVQVCTSASIEHETDLFSMYPNPFSEFFYIQAKEKILKIIMYDMTGKVCNIYTDVKNNYRMGNELSDGMYMVEVITNDQIKCLKMIKKTP